MKLPRSTKAGERSLRDVLCVDALIVLIKLCETFCRSFLQYYMVVQAIRIPGRTNSVRSAQRRMEILRFLWEAKQKLNIHAICEVGTSLGGTIYLLSKAAERDARFITIDIANDWRRAAVLKALIGCRQHIDVVAGDSSDPATVDTLANLLGEEKLDILFIDGDHSYGAVRCDYELYHRFVKKGGWIAFHDIVPDYRTRYGIATESVTGGVPIFWNEIKRKFRSFEIVEDYEQDGYGIGIIQV